MKMFLIISNTVLTQEASHTPHVGTVGVAGWGGHCLPERVVELTRFLYSRQRNAHTFTLILFDYALIKENEGKRKTVL